MPKGSGRARVPRFVPVAVAAEELGVHPDTIRRWFRHSPPFMEWRRNEDGHVLVDVNGVPKDLIERAHRLSRVVADAAAQEVHGSGPYPELRRHLRWLEQQVEELGEHVRALTSELAAAALERQRVLSLLERQIALAEASAHRDVATPK